jgi:hypothetical protein
LPVLFAVAALTVNQLTTTLEVVISSHKCVDTVL